MQTITRTKREIFLSSLNNNNNATYKQIKARAEKQDELATNNANGKKKQQTYEGIERKTGAHWQNKSRRGATTKNGSTVKDR